MVLTGAVEHRTTAMAKPGTPPIARAISSPFGHCRDRPRMEPATGNPEHRSKPATKGTLFTSRPYPIAIAAALATHGDATPAPSHQSRRSTRIRNQHTQKPANAHAAVKPTWNADATMSGGVDSQPGPVNPHSSPKITMLAKLKAAPTEMYTASLAIRDRVTGCAAPWHHASTHHSHPIVCGDSHSGISLLPPILRQIHHREILPTCFRSVVGTSSWSRRYSTPISADSANWRLLS